MTTQLQLNHNTHGLQPDAWIHALLDVKAAVLDRKGQAVAATPSMMIEPMREPLKLGLDLINAVMERSLPATSDLLKLRDFVAKVGSNLKLNSRKVLWDWVSPYALLAERALSTEWQPQRKQ